ncbi:MAG: cysteine--tRNA ligase [Phycisphaerales bacterium]|nr:cysteine--tRNA ligase [Phycisphaerales bacterium]
MALRLYNSLTKSVEDFRPADPDRVTFYTCGPTVYDFAHIGNFRSFLMADVLRRWLESPLCELVNETPEQKARREKHGRTVVHVMNITDVGHMTDDNSADGAGVDRMEEGGRRLLEAKKSGKLPAGAPDQIDPRNPAQIAAYYAGAFLEDAKLLGLKVAHEADADPSLMPRPTQRIPEMIAMIRDLIDKGCAYLVGEPGARGAAVYFDVQKFPDYGRLSGNTLDRLRAGAGGRVSEANQAGKRHPADFLLWKVDPAHVMKWGSPWGAGYPGWHIECSAMARERLGDVIDLHSGGEDNIFPHHECEIAQSRCATGSAQFARHWLHVRHLLVEGEKMSKSKGNFYTIRDLLEKGGDEITPAAIRLELIKTHYRANANFTIQGLKDSARQIRRWRELRGAAPHLTDASSTDAAREFAFAMHDDLNVAAAMAALNAWPTTHGAPASPAQFLQALAALGLDDLDASRSTSTDSAAIDSLIAARNAAKKAKNFAEADRIRAELAAMGIEIKDTPQGTTWSRKASL